MTTQTFKKLPGVFSFQRGYNISDGEMFNLFQDGTSSPVDVIRHGIRGTQNVIQGSGDTAKSGERNVSNIQVTETAKLHPEATSLQVRFSMRMFDINYGLSACASDDKTLMQGMRESVVNFITRAKASESVDRIAQRFARNIANGRWLWRNRVAASKVTIKVEVAGKQIASFDALKTPINHFDDSSADEIALANQLSAGMRGESSQGLTITATLDFATPGAVEVFPSQNYVENKPTGFARPLYKIGGSLRRDNRSDDGFDVVGHAALRDQKISNALRTFDTWYPNYDSLKRPVPVEPNGASLDLMEFVRGGKESAFNYFKCLNTLDPASPDGLFALACMLRGGVFSESDKGEKNKKETEAEA